MEWLPSSPPFSHLPPLLSFLLLSCFFLSYFFLMLIMLLPFSSFPSFSLSFFYFLFRLLIVVCFVSFFGFLPSTLKSHHHLWWISTFLALLKYHHEFFLNLCFCVYALCNKAFFFFFIFLVVIWHVLVFVVWFSMFVLQVHGQSSIISNNFLLCFPYSYCFNIVILSAKVVLAMFFPFCVVGKLWWCLDFKLLLFHVYFCKSSSSTIFFQVLFVVVKRF